MSNPAAGGLGKAAEMMMEQIRDQALTKQKAPGQRTQVEHSFQEVLAAQQGQGVQPPNQPQRIQPEHTFADAVRVMKESEMAARGRAVEPVNEPKRMEGVKRLMSGVMDGQNALDKIISVATSGKQFNNQELLAMQASVYKFSQELELTSKVVEKATSGVKQTMQTQV